MDIINKAQINWACRRGMLELDITIIPFFEQYFDTLDYQDKWRFVRLLECDDLDLFNWLINHGNPEDRDLQQIISIIQTRNRVRSPCSM